MPWVKPKQDWVHADHFFLDDWNRIVSNAKYLYSEIGATFEWRDCDLPDAMALPYYDLVTALESNLLDLCNSSGFSFVEFEATTWYARTSVEWTHNPSAEDFIRWETLEAQLYYWNNIANSPNNTLHAGTFYAGINRVTQMLSRGR